MSGQLHVPADLLPGKNSGTHWTVGWLGTKGCLERFVEKKILCLWRDSNSGPSIPWRSRYANSVIPIPLANFEVSKQMRISWKPIGLSVAQRRIFGACWSGNAVSVFWYIMPHHWVNPFRTFRDNHNGLLLKGRKEKEKFLLGHFDFSRWDHYVAPEDREPITQ